MKPDFRSVVTRRSFLKTSSLAALAFPAIMRGQGGVSPNRRLNVAIIGAGGIGATAIPGMINENIVAFCDVDEARTATAYRKMKEQHPAEWARHENAPRFNDYRRMFEKLGNQIDAVTIPIPDHMHFPAAMTALSLGSARVSRVGSGVSPEPLNRTRRDACAPRNSSKSKQASRYLPHSE